VVVSVDGSYVHAMLYIFIGEKTSISNRRDDVSSGLLGYICVQICNAVASECDWKALDEIKGFGRANIAVSSPSGKG